MRWISQQYDFSDLIAYIQATINSCRGLAKPSMSDGTDAADAGDDDYGPAKIGGKDWSP